MLELFKQHLLRINIGRGTIMPPRYKFTKEEIINCAIDLIREDGIGMFSARNLAKRLGSSSKVIFGLFMNMEDLKNDVYIKAHAIYKDFLLKYIEDSNQMFYLKASLAYITFAKEETNLFKILFMQDISPIIREKENNDTSDIIEAIHTLAHIPYDIAKEYHLHMWIFMHGIATQIATSYLDWNMDDIEKILTTHFNGLKSILGDKNGTSNKNN